MDHCILRGRTKPGFALQMYQTSLFAAAHQASVSRSKYIDTSQQPPQKRKRESDSSGRDGTDSDATDDSLSNARKDIRSASIKPNASNSPSSSSEPEGIEIPGGDFPHAYPKCDPVTKLLDKNQLTEELAGLNLDPNAQLSGTRGGSLKQQSTLRQQHVTNVVTILHRCLLEGDYVRASRTWGILLRVEQKRDPQFLCSNGRWGIGAEILLRQNPQAEEDAAKDPCTDSDSETGRRETVDLPVFAAAHSEEVFEKVRKYFDTLCVLYPHRKRSTNPINEHIFKYAMFGLWIHFVQEHAAVIKNGGQSRTSQLESEIESHLEDGHIEEQLRKSQTYLLEQARKILSELELLVTKAEFTDDKPLCKLKDMAKEWVEDLLLADAPSSQECDGD